MWNVEDLFVLSDFHLAAERDAGSPQPDAELAACLRWILNNTRDSLIVLAGDVLDFTILTDGNTKVDTARLRERTRAIVEHHPEMFEALSELVNSSPRHQLVWMGGDRDSELIFPPVQEEIELRLGGDLGNPLVRWLVHGEALRVRVGEAVVLVEHGNALDPWNRINYHVLHSAFSLVSRNLPDGNEYQPPLGRKLALEVSNQLRGTYRWVDCLKPETEAVLPLLWYAASQQQDRIFSLAEEHLSNRDFALNKKIGNARDPDRLYKGERETENSAREKAFEAWYRDPIVQQRLTPTAGEDGDRLIRKLRPVSARDTFFELERPDDSVKYLRPAFEGGADLVIHGHTHSAKACAVEGGFYVNTGTWGRLLRLPRSSDGDGAWQVFLDLLRKNDVECFRRPTMARVRLDPRQGVTTTALLEWQRGGPKTLAARRFSDRRSGWQKDGTE